MSEPARKRRMFGHPQWGQTPSLSSQSFSGSEFTFTSDATTGTSYSADSSTFPNVDPFPTDTLPLDVFSYDYPIVTAQGLPVTEAAPLPFDSIPPLLHLHSDAQTQFSGPSNASLDPSLPTQHEVWQNHQGPPDAPLLTEEPNYDIDVSSTLPLDDIWRNTSLYRLDGGMSFESRPVVSTSDIWSRKRGWCFLAVAVTLMFERWLTSIQISTGSATALARQPSRRQPTTCCGQHYPLCSPRSPTSALDKHVLSLQIPFSIALRTPTLPSPTESAPSYLRMA